MAYQQGGIPITTPAGTETVVVDNGGPRITTLTVDQIAGRAQAVLPPARYVTAALESAAIPAASLADAAHVSFDNTGTTPANLQMPTAAQLYAALLAAFPAMQIGFAYDLSIRNSSGSANTATITTNTGITLTGTMTIAQNTTRNFVVTVVSATAITVQSMGISAAGA